MTAPAQLTRHDRPRCEVSIEARKPANRGSRVRLFTTLLGLMLACGELKQGPGNTEVGAPVEPPPKPDPGLNLRLAFDTTGVELTPGDSAEIGIQVTPAGVHRVQIALLGDTEGAYADQSELVTNDRGEGRVKITVASDSDDLRLRAAIGSASAELRVQVTPEAVGSLRITPEYSGSRNVGEWSVSIEQDVPCLGLSLYDAVYGTPTRATPPLVVEDVPANRRVTLLLRGEQYVFGCREGVLLEPVQEQLVSVQVTDRPVQLPELNLPISISLDSSPQLMAGLSVIVDLMVTAFRGGKDHDMEALLERMAQRSGSYDAFVAAQQQDEWLQSLSDALTTEGATNGLSSRVQLWLQGGLSSLFDAGAFQGTVTGNIPPATRALLSLQSVVGEPPRTLGVPDAFLIDVALAPEDRLQLGMSLIWQPARLLALLGERTAREESSADAGTQTASSPLDDAGVLLSGERSAAPPASAYTIDCAAVASLLAGPDALAFEGCDTLCLQTLCESGVADMWESARMLQLPVASFEITSVQEVRIDTQARPRRFDGPWVGQAFLGPAGTIGVSGALRAGDPQ